MSELSAEGEKVVRRQKKKWENKNRVGGDKKGKGEQTKEGEKIRKERREE